ncbi:MAG: hypothetical protein CL972_02445 [Euryarchaeota archaeon]|nr:hypothetical protein [Euryarchaeota archaeon]
MIMRLIFSASSPVQDPPNLGADEWSSLDGLQWGSVCPSGNESSFLLGEVRPLCEDDRTFALA